MTPISISTHVLDTARGRPVDGVALTLARTGADGAWETVATSRTDVDGRVADLVSGGDPLPPGTYRLHFDLRGTPSVADGWYPEVSIVIELEPGSGHSHVPLLLAPYGYSTYRGS